VAVTDYEFWQTDYNGQPDILGATIRLDGKPFTIVGVSEPGFFGLNVGRRFDVAIALNGYRTLYPDSLDRISNSFSIVGRLKRGQTLAAAEAEVRARQPAIRAALQLTDNMPLLAKPLSLRSIASGLSTTMQEQYARPLTVLMALVVLVLLIACANVANLLIARAAARTKEVAVRIGIGAGRGRLLRQFLVESLALAGLGGAFGLAIAALTTRGILVLLDSGPAPLVLDTGLNAGVLGFATLVVVSLLTRKS